MEPETNTTLNFNFDILAHHFRGGEITRFVEIL